MNLFLQRLTSGGETGQRTHAIHAAIYRGGGIWDWHGLLVRLLDSFVISSVT